MGNARAGRYRAGVSVIRTSKMEIDLATANHSELFHFLWQTKYAPMLAQTGELERQWMAESFIDGTYTVCGEELRWMTPRDLCVLDGCESPFVCHQKIPEAEDVAFFVWHLSANNTGKGIGNAFRRGRCYGKLVARERDLAMDVAEVEEYCARALVCMPEAKANDGHNGNALPPKPIDVHFLAYLMVEIAAVIGPIDPMSGRPLADIPLPRLMQYKSEIERRSGRSADNKTEADVMRSRCLEEVNNIVKARTKQASVQS